MAKAIQNINGIMIIQKEVGYTSFDVVAKLRGITGIRKIGHTGTLDPAATGVLPVCLGNATRVCSLLTDWDKEYVAELLLGKVTDTLDLEGEVLETRETDHLTGQQVEKAILSFLGGYDQIPPMYSALKVNGQRLYDLARRGQEVERKPRPVRIPELEILGMELPVVRFRVLCSKGTYIRSLCNDIGEKLGCGGCMKSLVRTKVGPFGLEDARTLGQVEEILLNSARENSLADTNVGQDFAGNLSTRDGDMEGSGLLHSVESLFADLPFATVLPESLRYLENGNKLRPSDLKGQVGAGRLRIHRPDGSFAGIYLWDTGEGLYRPEKLFL